MLIESLKPLTVRLPERDLHLRPGYPIDLPDDQAAKLLARAPGKVRVVESDEVVLEPAAAHPRPIYWETGTGEILGPARPEFLARVGHGEEATFWVVTTFQGSICWICSDRLRSKQQFDAQPPIQTVELIREPHDVQDTHSGPKRIAR